jgi:hypothetical protein
MIERADLDAAVTAGILTDAQAAALRDLAAEREKVRTAALSHEERFRFMEGFNEVFLALGIFLLAAGLAFFSGLSLLANVLGATVMWALSELLVRHMRLVLPGILLSILFAYFVFLAVPAEEWLRYAFSSGARELQVGDRVFYLPGGLSSPLKATAFAVHSTIAACATAAYYVRFRLPFALLPIAASLVAIVLSLTFAVMPAHTRWIVSLVTVLCGAAVFAAAMSFDVSDRERMTRRADCAFWLHLLAAPLIVHSVISFVTEDFRMLTWASSSWILAIVAVLAAVAIAIDRRALLVSALVYLGAVIFYAISGSTRSPDTGAIFFATLLILGASVITLGVSWLPLRRRLMTHMSPTLASKLPPIPLSA